MNKLVVFLFILLIPLVSALEDDEECGITNFITCLPQKFFEFLIGILNAPIKPLLSFVKSLLTEPINISRFLSLWVIILYAISMFYGLLMFYAGFNFMISGHDVIKRAKAKEWFQNIFIMIVLIQASYFLYSLVIDIGSMLTAGIVNMIDQDFFLLTADNIINIGLQFLFAVFYGFVLIITALILILRYLIVAVGIVFVPIGIFLYFVPPLNSYGKLILNFLGVCIFVTFFDALIFLVSSKIIDIGIFASFKILVMIASFSIANLLMIYLIVFTAIKSALKLGGDLSTAVVAITK